MGKLFSQPWRPLPKNNYHALNFLKSYKPQNKDVSHLRILVIGPAGAGKSSFINSVDSVLQGRVTGRAKTNQNSLDSYTMKYKTYKFSKGNQDDYSFVCTDIMGLEKTTGGVHVEDIKLALKGHVKEGYEFNPNKQLKAGNPGYKSCPDLNDRFHVLVTVVPAGSVSLLRDDTFLDKLKDVRMAAREMDIPQMAVLTKVDEVCPEAKKNPNNIYKSKYLKQQVDKFSQVLGLPQNCIFLVKNYSLDIDTDAHTDAHILCALKQMILFGEDFLNHLNDWDMRK